MPLFLTTRMQKVPNGILCQQASSKKDVKEVQMVIVKCHHGQKILKYAQNQLPAKIWMDKKRHVDPPTLQKWSQWWKKWLKKWLKTSRNSLAMICHKRCVINLKNRVWIQKKQLKKQWTQSWSNKLTRSLKICPQKKFVSQLICAERKSKQKEKAQESLLTVRVSKQTLVKEIPTKMLKNLSRKKRKLLLLQQQQAMLKLLQLPWLSSSQLLLLSENIINDKLFKTFSYLKLMRSTMHYLVSVASEWASLWCAHWM